MLAGTVGKYTEGLNVSDNPAHRRGYALALGVLPARFLGATPVSLEGAIAALERATRQGGNPGCQEDAETRRKCSLAVAPALAASPRRAPRRAFRRARLP